MENSNECKKNFVAVYDGSNAIEDLKVRIYCMFIILHLLQIVLHYSFSFVFLCLSCLNH